MPRSNNLWQDQEPLVTQDAITAVKDTLKAKKNKLMNDTVDPNNIETLFKRYPVLLQFFQSLQQQ